MLLVDTYDTLESGVKNAVEAFNSVLVPKGLRPAGIIIDSGDMTYLSKRARRILDEAGFPDCDIYASNSLDEVLIKDEGFSREDAVFAAEHCGLNWDDRAILCAKEAVMEGESKNGVIETLQYYGFNKEQIDKAIIEAGY